MGKSIKIFLIGLVIFLIGIISFYFTSKLPGAIPLSDYKGMLLLFSVAILIVAALMPIIDKLINKYLK